MARKTASNTDRSAWSRYVKELKAEPAGFTFMFTRGELRRAFMAGRGVGRKKVR